MLPHVDYRLPGFQGGFSMLPRTSARQLPVWRRLAKKNQRHGKSDENGKQHSAQRPRQATSSENLG